MMVVYRKCGIQKKEKNHMTRGYTESVYNISSIPEGKLIYIFKMVLKSSFKGSYWKGDRLRAANPATATEQVRRGKRSHV